MTIMKRNIKADDCTLILDGDYSENCEHSPLLQVQFCVLFVPPHPPYTYKAMSIMKETLKHEDCAEPLILYIEYSGNCEHSPLLQEQQAYFDKISTVLFVIIATYFDRNMNSVVHDTHIMITPDRRKSNEQVRHTCTCFGNYFFSLLYFHTNLTFHESRYVL